MKTKIKRFLDSDKAISLMGLPALILIFVFVFIPLLSGIEISFSNWNGFSQSYGYVGFDNYVYMFQDKMFYTALKNTLIYGFGSTLIQTVLGLSYALLLQNSFRMRTLTRTVIYLPAMIAQVVLGYIWYFIVRYDGGALNDIIMMFDFPALDWMAVGTRAVIIVTIINALGYVGKTMVIFIAGLQGVSPSYIEAAEIDGATYLQALFHITIPQLRPAFITSIMLNVIGGLKIFGLVTSLTSGGPGYSSHSLSSFINMLYFSYQDAGYASAVGMATFVIIVLISLAMQKIINRKEMEY